MSVENEINTFKYLGDGSTTAFPISFVFFDASDIRVFINGVLQSSGYSIVGDNVVFDVPPALNADIFGRRVIPITQPIEYPQLDKFPSISHERSLDRLTFIAQQQQNDINASLKLPEGIDVSSFARLPAPQAGRSIKWNASGNAFINTENDPDELVATAQSASATAVSAANTATIEAGIAVAASASATAAAALLPLNNFSATTDPTVNDDNTQGYSGGSRWTNTVSGDRFTAISVATGAAVWQLETAVTIGDLGTAAFLNTGTASGEIPTNADLGAAAFEDVASSGTGDLLREDGDGSQLTGIPLMKKYPSGELAITAGGELILAHGLGKEPELLQAKLICKTANLNYPVGAVVYINTGVTSSSASRSAAIYIDNATEIKVRFGNDSQSFTIPNKNTGVLTAITNSSWRLIITAFA